MAARPDRGVVYATVTGLNGVYITPKVAAGYLCRNDSAFTFEKGTNRSVNNNASAVRQKDYLVVCNRGSPFFIS